MMGRSLLLIPLLIALLVVLAMGEELSYLEYLELEENTTNHTDTSSANATVEDYEDGILPLRATYKGRFQLLADGCQGSPPTVQAVCHGEQIALVNTSHSTIECEQSNPEQATLTCSSTCTNKNCQLETYLNDGTYTVADGPWGEVIYQCHGNSIPELDTRFVYQAPPENGTCSWRWFFDNELYHVAQLGVLCEPPSEEEEVTVIYDGDPILEVVVSRVQGSTPFTFDDTYLECSRGDSAAIQIEGPENDGVFCAVGQNCGGEDCQVSFHAIEVQADVERIPRQCFETLAPTTAAPGNSTTETLAELPQGKYTMQFQAGWSLLMKNPNFWYDNDDIHYLREVTTVLEFTCTHHGTIEFIETSNPHINCTHVDGTGNPMGRSGLDCHIPLALGGASFVNAFDTVLHVAAGEESFVNSFDTVTYTCTAENRLPTTHATYHGNVMTFVEDVSFDDLVVGHALQIGHYCSSHQNNNNNLQNDAKEESDYRYQDYDYECGSENQYLLLDKETESLGDRLTCLETVPVTEMDTPILIPRVEMSTDWRNQEEVDPACYIFDDGTKDTIPTTTNTTNSTSIAP